MFVRICFIQPLDKKCKFCTEQLLFKVQLVIHRSLLTPGQCVEFHIIPEYNNVYVPRQTKFTFIYMIAHAYCLLFCFGFDHLPFFPIKCPVRCIMSAHDFEVQVYLGFVHRYQTCQTTDKVKLLTSVWRLKLSTPFHGFCSLTFRNHPSKI